ncbi:MAG TPA: hypothetical protein VLB85_03260 [Acidimicrobiia bacterium]|nr:hypothetical protein [Acidimicrobiia bacterium]
MTTPLLIPARGPLLTKRFTNLLVGLVLFGVGIGMMLQSEMGVSPWDVLHEGLANRFGLTVGIWSIIISGAVLLVWIPLREAYGVGTILNAVVIGVVMDLSVLTIPTPESVIGRAAMALGGIVLIGYASGLYIGARLGAGPRDGLMTGISRLGPSIRLTRTVIEVGALVIGWLLGGTLGIGTVAFAVLIGPIVQFFLPRFHIDLPCTSSPAR